MLSEQSMTACEGKLSLVECYKALQMFSIGKAPGNDGLTADFYKGFWNLLGQQFTDALNYSQDPGKRGHIVADTLLPTQMFPRLPARATFCCGHKFSGTQKMFDFVQRHFVSATNVSQFARPKTHQGQQCFRNNVSSFTRVLRAW